MLRGRPLHEEVATLFGTGYLSKAPGTWGSVFALPPAVLIMSLSGFWGMALATLAACLLGLWVSTKHSHRTGRKDPSEVVIDELAGQWLTLLPLGLFADWSLWYAWPLALLFFRFFDVLKPWPCESLERLPGGWGVMSDDLMAGVYGAIPLSLVLIGAQHV